MEFRSLVWNKKPKIIYNNNKINENTFIEYACLKYYKKYKINNYERFAKYIYANIAATEINCRCGKR